MAIKAYQVADLLRVAAGRPVAHRHTTALIAAAGSSTRMGGETSKQLLDIDGTPVLARTLMAHQLAESIDEIVLIARREDFEAFADLARRYGITKLKRITEGGDSRQASVLRGLSVVSDETKFIAISDGARCLVTPDMIDRVNQAAWRYDAASAATPVTDTVKLVTKNGYTEEMINNATGTVDVADEEIRAAREEFRSLVERFKAEIAPEAEKVREAGGLYILGTERHESRRIDNQLRGRSGRQGDPGESRFFLSLEDDLLRLFGAGRLVGLVNRLGLPDDEPIRAGILTAAIQNAQKRIEDSNFKRRKYVLTYDDVMNQQRNLIYAQRHQVLDGEDVSETIRSMMRLSFEETVAAFTSSEGADTWNLEGLEAQYAGFLLQKIRFQVLYNA